MNFKYVSLFNYSFLFLQLKLQFPNTNIADERPGLISSEPSLHRYRHFERRSEIREDIYHHSREEKLNGQNIFQTVKRLARSITIEELTEIANENITVESKPDDESESKKAKTEPIVIDKKDIELLEELNILRIIGRLKVFRQLFPQFQTYNRHLG